MLQAAAEAIVESPTEITSGAAAVSFNLVTQVQEMAVAFAPRLGAAIGVFILFLIGGKLLMKIIHRMGRSNRIDDELSNFLGRSAKVGMLLFGAVSALGTLGIDIGALIAGLGLTGFALGFAFKDTISNVLAGIMVIIYKPFDLDDIILVGKFEGRVRSIDQHLHHVQVVHHRRVQWILAGKILDDTRWSMSDAVNV